ncbi:MAG: cation:proton antiporter, partial [Coxiella sp. (in: Bacteria)]
MSQKGRLYVILITLTAVIITALEILDGTIVSVALNTMRGSLGATIDQMSWTMTAYITATAMFMPLTGFFVKRFGRRPLMLFAISGFGIASVLCGLATNITEIVILRFIQGGVGALLGPLSQGLIVDTFDKEDMGKAMSFYGIGLMTAPILGPIIGAVVTNSLGWRWCFFINVPIVIVALFAVMILLPSVPKAREHTKMDWQGLLWLIVSMGGLEYVLNRGNRLQWFGSNQIMIITVVAVFALIVFMSHSRSQGRRNIVNLTLLGNRDFGLSLIIMIGFAACYISVNAWIPTLLEQLQQYPVLTAGETMIPRGVASLASMIFTGLMIKRLSPILLMTLGMVFFASGCFMLSHFNVHVDQHFFLIAN